MSQLLTPARLQRANRGSHFRAQGLLTLREGTRDS